jgi:spermidine dehydrogenase
MKETTTEATDPGLNCVIDRREFIGGIGASALVAAGGDAIATSAARDSSPAAAGQAAPPNYPPLSTGLRGQYPGSFEVAHSARDDNFKGPLSATDTGERYDLVVVGGGISGLSAAHFFRKALGQDRKVLILDNHDDFGGHAKRNEFRHNGRTYIGFGGTGNIESPFPYSYTAKALITELGIDVASYRKHVNPDVYQGLESGVFFDREHFGGDRLVACFGKRPWKEFFDAAPLTREVRADLTRLHTEKVDYLANLSPQQKVEALKRMSYQDYLLKHAGLHQASLPYFAGVNYRNFMRVDTCPAYTAARADAPGFQGMRLPEEPVFPESDYFFHFPDGNASIARLLVSRLVPAVFDGPQDQETIVTARANYDALDSSSNPTRIRLRSTAIRVEHVGEGGHPEKVRVVYMRDGQRYQVIGANAVLACFNNIVPHIVPDLPDAQKKALGYASKVPLQITNVLVRNWEPWRKLGVQAIEAPNGYHTSVWLDYPVSIGTYQFPSDPQEPCRLIMVRNPNSPGLPRRDQHRVGRADMLATGFDKIESEIRSQLNRMLSPGGFEAKRDILAITVNRWPHGYAYTYDTLADPDLPEAERPHVLGRTTFGRIAIANADAGASAFTCVAIDQAHRAVQDCLVSRGLI